MEFQGEALRLGPDDISAVAAEPGVGLEPALIHAVCDVESGGSGFIAPPDNRPIILGESHAFHTDTYGKWDGSHPGISTSSWVRNYGPGGAHQYDRLSEMVSLDRQAGLRSCSWGRFQIMGSNFYMCGYNDVETFVAAMEASERAHLDAFIKFCQKSGALPRLKAHDFAGFARIYNGPGYAENGYDVKLAAAYRKWVTQPEAQPGNTAPRTLPEHYHAVLFMGMPGPNAEVAQVQTFLHANDNRIVVDGLFGAQTQSEVEAIQQAHGLGVDGIIGPATRPFVGLAA
jgi:hypothetical protein